MTTRIVWLKNPIPEFSETWPGWNQLSGLENGYRIRSSKLSNAGKWSVKTLKPLKFQQEVPPTAAQKKEQAVWDTANRLAKRLIITSIHIVLLMTISKISTMQRPQHRHFGWDNVAFLTNNRHDQITSLHKISFDSKCDPNKSMTLTFCIWQHRESSQISWREKYDDELAVAIFLQGLPDSWKIQEFLVCLRKTILPWFEAMVL